MTDPIKSLAARYYTDPQIYKAEKAGLLARTWQFGCHASELSNTGDYATFEIAGESLFAIRGRDDKIRVFYNVCLSYCDDAKTYVHDILQKCSR